MSSYTVVIITYISYFSVFVSGQVSSPVTSLENNKVRLTFNIPSDLINTIIPVRLNVGGGKTPLDVFFIKSSDFSGYTVNTFVNRINVTSSLIDRKVYVDFIDVSAADAGTYTCYDGIDYNVLANCGQQLVIVRKPNKPSIQELTIALEGATLKLACNSNSTSLPTDHGLKSATIWRNEQNQIVGVPGTYKFIMDIDGHLEIRNIERADKGRKLTCTSSDIADGIRKSPESDQSQAYEIKPGFKPSASDILLRPPVTYGDKISKNESEDMTYICDTTCNPPCTVQWSFKSFNSSSFVSLLLADPKTLHKTVHRTNQGTYRCSATNKLGAAHKEFIIEVYCLPPPATKVAAVDEKHDAVTIVWLASSGCTGFQFFNVEYRQLNMLPGISTWSTSVSEMKVEIPQFSEIWMEADVKHLHSNMDYEFRIKVTNSLGSAVSQTYRFKTSGVQDVGIIIGMAIGTAAAVMVVIFIIASVPFIIRHKCKKSVKNENKHETLDVAKVQTVSFRPGKQAVKNHKDITKSEEPELHCYANLTGTG